VGLTTPLVSWPKTRKELVLNHPFRKKRRKEGDPAVSEMPFLAYKSANSVFAQGN